MTEEKVDAFDKSVIIHIRITCQLQKVVFKNRCTTNG